MHPFTITSFAILTAEANLQACIFQAALMREFFADVSEFFLDRNARDQVPKRLRTFDVCGRDGSPSWNGITCKSGEVISVQYARSHAGRFHIEHLPPTVQIVRLENSQQSYTMSTRQLPRELIQFDMSNNFIRGTLDLSGIPDKTKIFRMDRNQITGPIDIRSIPESLQILGLEDNRIEQEVVYYGMISKNMVQMSFRGNAIPHVRAEIPQYKESAKKVKFLINNKARLD